MDSLNSTAKESDRFQFKLRFTPSRRLVVAAKKTLRLDVDLVVDFVSLVLNRAKNPKSLLS